MEKINQRVMISKRLLKESFTQLLQKKDIRKISIRELCQDAGINHCTFYKYYGSQYDLLKEMEDDMLDKLESTISGVSDGDPLVLLLGYMEENLEIARLLINNNVDPLFPEKLFSLPIVQKKFSAAFHGQCGEQRFAYVTNFIFYGACRTVQLWLNKDSRESPAEMAEILLRLIPKPEP